MAHLIDLSNDRANMAYVGQVPWHGLGQRLTEGAPIDVWAKEAGMSHSIERAPASFTHPSGELITLDDRDVLWRSDNHMPLAVVSHRYNVVQPMEILEFYRELVGATGDYELETAGCLDGGKKYWALAKYKKDMAFGNDIVKPYLFLGSSADGTLATTAMHTSVRVVCNNTLQMSLRQDQQNAISVPHSVVVNFDELKSHLGVTEAHDEYQAQVEELINKSMTQRQAAEIFVNLTAKRDEDGNLENEATVKRVVSEIMESLTKGPGAELETSYGTAWGALNAVTHYVDFKAGARSNNNRFASGQLGRGACLKKQAYQLLAAA